LAKLDVAAKQCVGVIIRLSAHRSAKGDFLRPFYTVYQAQILDLANKLAFAVFKEQARRPSRSLAEETLAQQKDYDDLIVKYNALVDRHNAMLAGYNQLARQALDQVTDKAIIEIQRRLLESEKSR